MTPQIARIAATRMRERPMPLRLSYSGRVLRHTEQQMGKDRDIFQTGVELIGLDSPEADAEMIVMTTHGYSGMKHVLLGSTTEDVLRHASCPVLSVRAKN